MPRANPSPLLIQRRTTQTVAAQTRDVLGAVEAVAEQTTLLEVNLGAIDGAIDGGVTASLGTKLADIEARLDALEP